MVVFLFFHQKFKKNNGDDCIWEQEPLNKLAEENNLI